ncbi:hypothetical protein FQR65_LT20082 [Abscondita terminalis]|nr:hypothetical protein FQR65_LT20082 [Abscondita terminalis]
MASLKLLLIINIWLTVDKRQPNPSKGDIKLGEVRHTGNLEVGEDYIGNLTVTIPEGTYSGQYYITVWSDTYDIVKLYSGEKVSVSWTVENKGADLWEGTQSWTDYVLISAHPSYMREYSTVIGSLTHSNIQSLKSGQTYTASGQFNVPAGYDGKYYIYVISDAKIDEDGYVYYPQEIDSLSIPDSNEYTLKYYQTTVFEQDINPDSGDTITVTWTVMNQGTRDTRISSWYDGVFLSLDENIDRSDYPLIDRGSDFEKFTRVKQTTIYNAEGKIDVLKVEYQAYGQWSDAIYLSKDNVWDKQDILLGRFTHNGGLISQGSYTGSIEAFLPAIQDGQWYIVIRPDIYNEVYEGDIFYTETGLNIAPNEANNEMASASTIAITVPKLLLNTSTDLTLSSGDSYLYKVGVTAGETLRIRLDSSAMQGANELYIRYEAVPGSGEYDYAYTLANSPDQEILVPTTKAGNYYILVKSTNSTKNSAATIIAETLPLSITKVTPDQGGTGTNDYRWVTVDIYGAQFSSGALVKLSRPGVYEIEPERWQLLDATHIRAVFDLRKLPTMLLTFIVVNPNEGLNLPFLIFGSNIGGQPSGVIYGDQANTQHYGITPTNQSRLKNIPWAELDKYPKYFWVYFFMKTYPGLKEWIAMDFEGLREQLYIIHPDWKAQGLLDNGVNDLNKIQPGLQKAAANTNQSNWFINDQIKHALKMRDAILVDSLASMNLKALAADENQWVQGWLAALEEAGLLRPENEAPPIRENIQVLSLTANLATGLLLSKAGESYKSQASIKAFFEQIQQWYGDTSKWAGDPKALSAKVAYYEIRTNDKGDQIESPVPKNISIEDLILNHQDNPHFINFNVFVGNKAHLEYLRNIGLLDGEFNPIGAQALALKQYLQQLAAVNDAIVHVQGPSVMPHTDGKSYVPAETALPYKISFQNTSEASLNQIRLVTQIDEQLDPYTVQLTDIKVGDINIRVPDNRSSFTSDFDFSGSLGFILRVSAGVDAESRILTWLIQAIDPATGEISKQNIHSLLKLDGNNKGFVGYTVQSLETVASGEEIVTQARIHLNGTPPVDSQLYRYVLDNKRPVTNLSVTSQQSTDTAQVHYKVNWNAQDDLSGNTATDINMLLENRCDFQNLWKKQITQAQGEALFVGQVVKQTAQIPQAMQDRNYLDNPLFIEAKKGFAGQIDKYQKTDLNSILSPFTLTAFASGFNTSQGDIGALAMIELPDFRILVEQVRNLYLLLISQSWIWSLIQKVNSEVLTGAEYMVIGLFYGQVIERIKGPSNEPLTHALAVEPYTDRIYVSSGNGIEIFDINAPENQRWTHFSNALVSDLAFAPDGRLWAVRWTSANILSNIGKTDIISLALEGKTKGRAGIRIYP